MGGAEWFPDILKIRLADTLAQSDYKREEKMKSIAHMQALYEEILADADCLTVKDLAVNGGDLIALGVKPGKDMGDMLNRMLEDVLESPEHNTKEYLVEKYVRDN